MKNRIFNVMENTQLISEYPFPKNSNQERMAKQLNAKRILYWDHDCRGKLPLYVINAIKLAGYTVEKIGYTTYVSNTFALMEVANLER